MAGKHQPSIEAVVVGNVAFDILCYPVNDVPRHHSLTFDRSAIAPGGCGSNAVIGLAAQNISSALVACIGKDIAGDLAMNYWERFGVHTGFVTRLENEPTGVSVGLVDSDAQPRFVHTSGSNQFLTPENIPLDRLLQHPLKAVHFAGYFLMAGMLDPSLTAVIKTLKDAKVFISLDVQQTARLSQPDILWSLLPLIDVFTCNRMEAAQLTGSNREESAANTLHNNGAQNVIIKLGEQGCYLSSPPERLIVPAPRVKTSDTTGAGDAFSAGLIAAVLRGQDLIAACRWANAVAANIVTHFGATAGWEDYRPENVERLLNN